MPPFVNVPKIGEWLIFTKSVDPRSDPTTFQTLRVDLNWHDPSDGKYKQAADVLRARYPIEKGDWYQIKSASYMKKTSGVAANDVVFSLWIRKRDKERPWAADRVKTSIRLAEQVWEQNPRYNSPDDNYVIKGRSGCTIIYVAGRDIAHGCWVARSKSLAKAYSNNILSTEEQDETNRWSQISDDIWGQ